MVRVVFKRRGDATGGAPPRGARVSAGGGGGKMIVRGVELHWAGSERAAAGWAARFRHAPWGGVTREAHISMHEIAAHPHPAATALG
jgi:hypothetical protein